MNDFQEEDPHTTSQPLEEGQPVPVKVVDPVIQDVNVLNPEVLAPVGKRRPEPSMAPSLAPTTTLEEDIRTQAQRDLNMTWENTQSTVARAVVITTCGGVVISLTFRGLFPDRLIAFPAEWWTVVGLVIGFYFGRTNHARTSGAGPTGGSSKSSGVNMNPLDDREGPN